MSRVAVMCLLVAVVALTLGDDKYSDRYDNINLDDILNNDRLLARYKECVVNSDDSKCSEDGKTLKRVLAEALNNDCAKCTDKQKAGAKKAIKFLHSKKPEIWEPIAAKYDPSGEFLKHHPELAS